MDESESSTITSDEEHDEEHDDDLEEDEQDEQQQEEINNLRNEVSLNLYNYESHIKLITKLRQAGELELLRDARQRMSSLFPLTPKLWLEWINDEKNLSSTQEDKLNIVKLFEKAVCDYTSIDLWFEFVQYSIGLMNEPSFGIEAIREIFERALTNVGLHVVRGNLLWETYREFENVILQKIQISDPNKPDENVKSEINRIFDIFKRQLSIPLCDMHKTHLECQHWCQSVTEVYSIELDFGSVKTSYEKALEHLQDLMPYEESLSNSDDPHLEEYLKYIEYEQDQDNLSRVQCIYERALVDNCLVSDLWVRYTKYLDKKIVVDSIIIPVYDRAVRNCFWSSTLWINYIRSLERLKQPHSKVLTIFETALQAGFQQGQEFRQLWLTYLDYLRRKTNWTDENQVKSLRKTFEKATEHLSNYADADPNCTILQYLAKIEAKFCKNINNCREIWNNLLNSRSDISAQAQCWIDFANLERLYGDEKHYRKVLVRGLSCCNDWPESVGQLLITYEREEGTSIENYDEVINKYDDVMKRITEKRKIAAEKEIEARKQHKVQKKQEKYELKRSLKRKHPEQSKDNPL